MRSRWWRWWVWADGRLLAPGRIELAPGPVDLAPGPVGLAPGRVELAPGPVERQQNWPRGRLVLTGICCVWG